MCYFFRQLLTILNITIISFILTLLLSSLWTRSDAQTQIHDDSQTINQLFNLAAQDHRQELNTLFGMRGSPLIELRDVSSEDIAHVLSIRPDSDNYYNNEATYQAETAVLFYSYHQQNLQVWLLDEGGIQAFQQRRITREQIDEASNRLRDSFHVDSLQLSRSPHLRSLVAVVLRQTQRDAPTNHAIATLTDILLPST